MESKLRGNAGNAVKAILEAAGFEIQDVDAPVDFSAMREDEVLLVLCSNDVSEIEEFDRTKFSLKVDEQELECRKLVFSLEEGLRTEQSMTWGVKEFVRYAGEAALARVLERPLALSFAAAHQEAPAAGEEPSGADVSSGIIVPHFPIKVNKQAAGKIAGIPGNPVLRFMPHWFFRYVSSGESTYKDHRVLFDGEGSGAINAINGIRIEADGTAIAEREIPADAEVVKSHLSREEAIEQLSQQLITSLSRQVRIKQVKGDAIFYEEKTIRPDKNNITIDMIQVYVPVWQIRGKKIVEVNATNGEILSVPMDEGVEIL